MDSTKIIREACVGNIDQAIKAQELGADRIELCDRLDLDGLTPTEDMIIEAVNLLQIPIKVIIRPREGDFVYNASEMEVMMHSIDCCKANNVEGVVFGVLDGNGSLDLQAIALLAEKAAPMKVTIHKAIDQIDDPIQAIKDLKSLGNVHSVLTSGKAPTADEGQEMIKQMIEVAGDSLDIIVAGKVRHNNLEYLHKKINAREYHGRNIMG